MSSHRGHQVSGENGRGKIVCKPSFTVSESLAANDVVSKNIPVSNKDKKKEKKKKTPLIESLHRLAEIKLTVQY